MWPATASQAHRYRGLARLVAVAMCSSHCARRGQGECSPGSDNDQLAAQVRLCLERALILA